MAKEMLDSKIFLITFNKPKYVMEIGETIYGENRATYPKLMGREGAIKRCENKQWIIKTPIDPPEDKPLGFEKRTYYTSNIDLIIEDIDKKVDLKDNEKTDIEKILKSDTFKSCIADISNFIDFPNQTINAFEIIIDLIGYLCAYIYMVKNYGNYFTNKISELFPSKKQHPNWYHLGMKDLEGFQKDAEKKGFDKDQFLEDNKQIYAQLLPRSNVKDVIKGKIVDHYFELSKEFFVLPIDLLEKLSRVIPVHKYIFLNFITGGFISAENSNQLIMEKLINIIKPKKGFRSMI